MPLDFAPLRSPAVDFKFVVNRGGHCVLVGMIPRKPTWTLSTLSKPALKVALPARWSTVRDVELTNERWWVCGEHKLKGQLEFSTNAGKRWFPVTLPGCKGSLLFVRADSRGTVWVGGLDGLWRCNGPDHDFVPVKLPLRGPVFAFAESSHGLAFGALGGVLRTEGERISLVPLAASDAVTHLAFDQTGLLVAGRRGWKALDQFESGLFGRLGSALVPIEPPSGFELSSPDGLASVGSSHFVGFYVRDANRSWSPRVAAITGESVTWHYGPPHLTGLASLDGALVAASGARPNVPGRGHVTVAQVVA